jgi:hypothetical protein
VLVGGRIDETKFTCHDLARDPIFCKLTILLEVEEAGECVRTEYSVDLSRVESKRVQASLKFGDVVSTHHRNPVVEEAVPEAVARIYEGSPGVWSHDPVDRKPANGLEFRDRPLRSVSEDALRIVTDGEPERAQPVLDITNRLTSVSKVVEPHVLNGCRFGP